MLALPIFPGSRPPSIVGANELNFCVRDGNRWTLIAINTNYSVREVVSLELLYDSTHILICKELFFKKYNFFSDAEASAFSSEIIASQLGIFLRDLVIGTPQSPDDP